MTANLFYDTFVLNPALGMPANCSAAIRDIAKPVLIASTIYVVAWLIDYFFFIPDIIEKYSVHTLDGLKATGASPWK